LEVSSSPSEGGEKIVEGGLQFKKKSRNLRVSGSSTPTLDCKKFVDTKGNRWKKKTLQKGKKFPITRAAPIGGGGGKQCMSTGVGGAVLQKNEKENVGTCGKGGGCILWGRPSPK